MSQDVESGISVREVPHTIFSISGALDTQAVVDPSSCAPKQGWTQAHPSSNGPKHTQAVMDPSSGTLDTQAVVDQPFKYQPRSPF
jgi:hypothetical protein